MGASQRTARENLVSRKNVWSDGQDARIRRLRTEGASCDVIALLLGVTRAAVVERARILRVDHHPETDFADTERPPLPAGHRLTWGAINQGTGLENEPFHAPDTIR
jgi:hypothetical protein